ncbi:helix-turn-helix domain-containing protein [Candidatus Bipolaricaulota bacterium]
MKTEQPISDLLRFARQFRGLTQQSAARRLGTSERTLRRWESGTQPLPDHRARILDVSEAWIMQRIARIRTSDTW